MTVEYAIGISIGFVAILSACIRWLIGEYVAKQKELDVIKEKSMHELIKNLERSFDKISLELSGLRNDLNKTDKSMVSLSVKISDLSARTDSLLSMIKGVGDAYSKRAAQSLVEEKIPGFDLSKYKKK